MLRKATGIECYVNIISLSYAATRILPYSVNEFTYLQGKSAQQVRYALGAIITELIFLKGLVFKLQSIKKFKAIYNACKSALSHSLAS